MSTFDYEPYHAGLLPLPCMLRLSQGHSVPTLLFQGSGDVPTSLPTSFSLADQIPSVYDQQTVGSCVANAICQAFRVVEKQKDFQPSRLFLYYWARASEGSTSYVSDTGTTPQSALAYAETHGICSEAKWPYDVRQVNVKPLNGSMDEAVKHLVQQPFEIALQNRVLQIKQWLVQGFPVCVALAIYQSFMTQETARTGIIPMPRSAKPYDPRGSDSFLGGHEVMLCGWDDSKQAFQFVNSWSTKWGAQGFGWLPLDYVQNQFHCMDARGFRAVTDLKAAEPHCICGCTGCTLSAKGK